MMEGLKYILQAGREMGRRIYTYVEMGAVFMMTVLVALLLLKSNESKYFIMSISV